MPSGGRSKPLDKGPLFRLYCASSRCGLTESDSSPGPGLDARLGFHAHVLHLCVSRLVSAPLGWLVVWGTGAASVPPPDVKRKVLWSLSSAAQDKQVSCQLACPHDLCVGRAGRAALHGAGFGCTESEDFFRWWLVRGLLRRPGSQWQTDHQRQQAAEHPSGQRRLLPLAERHVFLHFRPRQVAVDARLETLCYCVQLPIKPRSVPA